MPLTVMESEWRSWGHMRVLVTGGNGFVGNALCRAVLERGDEVSALVRPESEVSALTGLAVRILRGDVTAPATLPAALEGIDTVFHLAGLRRCPTRGPFFEVNAEGTRHVCEAMVAS